jgi:hypothetical protein
MPYRYEEDHDCRPDFKLLSNRVSKARTEKCCDMCAGPILAGQQYRTIAALEDGKFSLRREHLSAPECAYAGEQRVQWEREAFDKFMDNANSTFDQ